MPRRPFFVALRFAAGLAYRLKSGLKALFTFRFRALAAAKIDGWG